MQGVGLKRFVTGVDDDGAVSHHSRASVLLDIARRLFAGASRPFAVELWNREILEATAPPTTTAMVKLLHPKAVMAFLPPWSERGLAQAYAEKDIDVDGDLVDLLAAATTWSGTTPKLAQLLGLVGRVSDVLGQPRRSIASDRADVTTHYDGSARLVRLFLDPELVYSCAYFTAPDESLEQAQWNKLSLVCKKLSLNPNERFLDIGCGWGALLRHASLNYGAHATGITLSQDQHAEARRRAAQLQLKDIEVKRCDYRELNTLGTFDKMASIGMMEHVGRSQLDAYFQAAFTALRPGGLFLNHAIASVPAATRLCPWSTRAAGEGFIDGDIFPGSELLPIADVLNAAERAGFEVRDVESLREHYDRTLCLWRQRLEGRFTEAVTVASERHARAFNLYLAVSAAAFRAGSVSVFQTLLMRPSSNRSENRPPSTREQWAIHPVNTMETGGALTSD